MALEERLRGAKLDVVQAEESYGRGETRGEQEPKMVVQRMVSEIERELRETEEELGLVENIHTIFDTAMFGSIETNLEVLKRIGVQTIEIGGRPFTVRWLLDRVDRAMKLSTKIHSGELSMDTHEIDNWLANNGFTRGKVSDKSEYGFREAIARAIANDTRAVYPLEGDKKQLGP